MMDVGCRIQAMQIDRADCREAFHPPAAGPVPLPSAAGPREAQGREHWRNAQVPNKKAPLAGGASGGVPTLQGQRQWRPVSSFNDRGDGRAYQELTDFEAFRACNTASSAGRVHPSGAAAVGKTAREVASIQRFFRPTAGPAILRCVKSLSERGSSFVGPKVMRKKEVVDAPPKVPAKTTTATATFTAPQPPPYGTGVFAKPTPEIDSQRRQLKRIEDIVRSTTASVDVKTAAVALEATAISSPSTLHTPLMALELAATAAHPSKVPPSDGAKWFRQRLQEKHGDLFTLDELTAMWVRTVTRQLHCQPDQDKVANHPLVKCYHRALAVDWLFSAGADFQADRETVQTAINYLDRFTAIDTDGRLLDGVLGNYQTVAAVFLWMAYKLVQEDEDTDESRKKRVAVCPEVFEYQNGQQPLAAGVWPASRKLFVALERRLITLLQGRLQAPTPHSFLCFLLQLLVEHTLAFNPTAATGGEIDTITDIPRFQRMTAVIDSMLTDGSALHYLPSDLAISVAAVALGQKYWPLIEAATLCPIARLGNCLVNVSHYYICWVETALATLYPQIGTNLTDLQRERAYNVQRWSSAFLSANFNPKLLAS
jgi:hypothetical protein